jgi:predicted HD superfamily hydrolase involved in NAD metabolism
LTDVQAIYDWLADRLTPDRLTHVLGVTDTAQAWANRLKLDDATTHHITVAALLHDNAKQWAANTLKAYLIEHNGPWHADHDPFPAVWHAWVGALEAQTVWGITEPAVLNAIRYHTTGHAHMGLVEQVVFVADKIEARTRDQDRVAQWHTQVMAMPGSNTPAGELHNWTKVLLGSTLQYLAQRHLPIHPDAVRAWNAMLHPVITPPNPYLLEDHAVVNYQSV